MLKLDENDKLMCLLPLNHVFGFVCSFLWGFTNTCPVILNRGARHYIDDLSYFKPTAVSLVPLLVGFFVKNNLFNEELKTVLVGAGDCPDILMKAVQSKGIHLSFGYGLTETSSGVAISTKGDLRAMEICPDNKISIAEDGEIIIENHTCMMKGYYKDDESTKSVLQNNILKTGDLGYLDEECKLHINGRKKEILVLNDGTKIFLPEYEANLSNKLGNNELCVLLKDNSLTLVIKTEENIGKIRELSDEVTKDLPRSQKIKDIIILDKDLPRNAAGKLIRWQIEKELNHD